MNVRRLLLAAAFTVSSLALPAVVFSPLDHAKVTPLADGGARVELAAGRQWSGVSVALGDGFTATRHQALEVGVTNLNDRPLRLTALLKAGARIRLREAFAVAPRGAVTHRIGLLPGHYALGFPLRGVFRYAPQDMKATLADARTLTVFEHNSPGGGFAVTGVRVVGEATPPELAVTAEADFFPFCDRYGQLRHKEWLGKVHSDAELTRGRAEEDAWLARHAESPIAGADRFGGWADGPRLAATGAFRVEKVEGRWWLVDPDGRLFFSSGIDGVRMPTASPTKGRERYFETLDGAAGGQVNFGLANLARKHGPAALTNGTVNGLNQRRLRAWGVNTIGNWSDPECWGLRQTVYVDHLKTHGVKFETLGKIRRTMIDVFADTFARNVRKQAEACARRSGDDPWCLGWFVDNELQWGADTTSLGRWVLAAKPDQPARVALVRMLRERHGEGFDPAAATDEDMEAFLWLFAERYYRTVRDAIRQAAPKRLYLGTRFCSSRVNRIVWAVAADYCDVLSVNWYNHHPDVEVPPNVRDRPLLIGEFHFGALDRGMLASGLVTVADQAARAEAYRRYMREAITSPRIVGAHWFLYRDQPLTGRPSDGEAYQAGFVDVADRPYPEMVRAARDIAAELYPKAPCAETR